MTFSRPRWRTSIARMARSHTRCGTIDRDEPSPARARPALDDAHVRGPLDGGPVQRAVSRQPRQGPDRALDRLRPAHPDGLRRRPRAGARRGREGRRAGRAQGRHARPARRHPARPHEHVDDDQRDGGVAAGALHRRRGGERHRPRGPPGHDPERHRQGVPVARDLRLPARPVDAADRRHRGLHGRARAEVESRQRLLLPPAGGRGHAPAGDRLRAGHGDRHPRRGAPAGARDRHGARVRPHLLLRQRRRAVRGGAREAARDGGAVGRARARALRRAGRARPPLPLRRAGQLARADRVPAREQRAADRARGARGDARPRRTRPRDPAPGLERGARAAAAVGPAVVAADPAGAGLRDRPARVPRPVRGLGRDGGARRRARGGRAGGARPGRRAGRHGRGGPVHEGGARRVPPGADRPDRVRRAGAGGREPLHGDRAVALDRGRRHPRGRPRRRGPAARGARWPGASGATTPPCRRRSRTWPGWPHRTRTSCRRRSPRRAPA